MILNQAGTVVADLGSFNVAAGVNGVSVALSHFVPEIDRTEPILAGSGPSIAFHGVDSGGAQLANGYYRVQLKTSTGATYFTAFYLQHQNWSGGSVIAALPLRGQEAVLAWNYPETVKISFDIYNLAGELVWQARAQAQIGQMRWPLRSASSQPVSGGIYLVKVRAVTLDGAADELRLLKLAVVR
jgi:hypothetical protein